MAPPVRALERSDGLDRDPARSVLGLADRQDLAHQFEVEVYRRARPQLEQGIIVLETVHKIDERTSKTILQHGVGNGAVLGSQNRSRSP